VVAPPVASTARPKSVSAIEFDPGSFNSDSLGSGSLGSDIGAGTEAGISEIEVGTGNSEVMQEQQKGRKTDHRLAGIMQTPD
jgi:hypothetical protein